MKGLQSFSTQATTAGKVHFPTIKPHDERKLAITQPHPALSNCIEDWLNVSRRPGDDPEHVRSCRLLFQRLRKIVGALAQFVEQPRVLNSDDSLRREVLHQFDLLVSKGTNFSAVNSDHTNCLTFLKHWYSDQRSDTA